MAVFNCQSCGFSLQTGDDAIGRKAKCPKCQQHGLVSADATYVPPVFPATSPYDADESAAGFQLTDLLNIRPLLLQIDSGELVTRFVGYAWQLIVLVIGLLFLLAWSIAWFGILGLPFLGKVAMFVFQVTSLVSVFFAWQVMFLRGQDIAKFGEARFVTVPIVARFIMASCEAMATYLSLQAIPAMLLTWFGGLQAVWFAPIPEMGSTSFLVSLIAGVVLLLVTWLMAFVIFFLGRLFGESMLAVFSVANNVQQIADYKST